jgi:hypothetical protein
MSEDNPSPKELRDTAFAALKEHASEFDAIVCGFDVHGLALGTLVAAELDMPLLIVCRDHAGCSISHIVCIGNVDPDTRFCYVDDWAKFGATWSTVASYMCQSETPNIVATFMATKEKYTRGSFVTKTGFLTRKRSTVWVSQ